MDVPEGKKSSRLPAFQGDRSQVCGEPSIVSLAGVTSEEARAYLVASRDDELVAALRLARDRIKLAGGCETPDELEIHHALFLLRRARGLEAPSFDAMRVELRRKLAA